MGERMDIDPDEIDQVLEEKVAASKQRRKPHAWRRSFTMLPRAWELRLLKAKRITSYHLGCELLYLHWLNGDKPIAVTNLMAKTLGLSPRSKSRALTELEQLGLITIDRNSRKAPRVTLLHVPGG